MSNVNLFGHIVGYVGEVSEPDGPRIVGYFLDGWAQEAQGRFEKWLTEHDAEVRADERAKIAAAIRAEQVALHRQLDDGMDIAAEIAEGGEAP